MGMRLVIALKKDNKIIGTSYKHWSGYTFCGLCDVVSILSRYEEMKKENIVPNNKYILAVELLHCNEEGLHPEEEELYSRFISKDYPLYIDRDKGWINITKKRNKSNIWWKDILFTIDLDSCTFECDNLLDYCFDDRIPEQARDKYIFGDIQEMIYKYKELNLDFAKEFLCFLNTVYQKYNITTFNDDFLYLKDYLDSYITNYLTKK